MRKYTLISTEKKGIEMRNEEGRAVPLTEILEIYPESRVYAFDAPMGAGKTTFISELCRELGTEDVTNSPTFAIVNVYEAGREEIYHFDCYRLKDIREAYDFGAEDYLQSGNYCFIEWPEIISRMLPEDTVEVTIEIVDDNTRILTIK